MWRRCAASQRRDDQMVGVQPFLPPRDRSFALADDTRLTHRGSTSCTRSRRVVVRGERTHPRDVRSLTGCLGIPVQIEPVVTSRGWTTADPFVEALVELGARGPINLQGRLDADGHVRFFELNARFTGITGVRTMMGFREVEAAVRALALDDGSAPRRPVDRRPARRAASRRRHGRRDATGWIELPGRRHAAGIASPSIRPPCRGLRASSYVGRSTVGALLPATSRRSMPSSGPRPPERSWQRGIADSRLDVHALDLLDDAIELPPADVVLHLAGVRAANDAPPFLFEVNVEGTRRILRAARDAGVARFAYLSTQAVYGSERPPPVGRVHAATARNAVRDEQVARRGDVPRRGRRGPPDARAPRRPRLRTGFRHALGGDAARVRPQDRQGQGTHHPGGWQPAHGPRARPRRRRRTRPMRRGRAAGSPTHGAQPRRRASGLAAQGRHHLHGCREDLGLDSPPVEQVAHTSTPPSFGMPSAARGRCSAGRRHSLTDAVRELVEARHDRCRRHRADQQHPVSTSHALT